MTIHLRLTGLLLTSALAFPARAQMSTVDTERAIEGAYLRVDASQLNALGRSLDAALVTDPKNPALLYVRAFAHYAATAPIRVTNNKEALQAELEKAAVLLVRVKGQPWEAEAAALHGSILGSLIGLKGGLSGMTLGPKSGRLLAEAEKALPGNPRVLFFRGIGLLNTPPMFGGDAVAGAKLLQQSVDAFTQADPAAPGPHWGRADALTWLGLAKKKAGDLAAARAAWEQALAIEPDCGWVKFSLLPSLDKPSKK